MEKALNSAMVEERMNEIVTRKNEIVDEVEAKKEEFESADTDKRDALLDEVEKLTEEADKIDEEVKDLEEQRSTLKAQEERMSLTSSLSKIAIEERKDQIKTMENNIDVRNTPEFIHEWRKAVMSGDDKNFRALLTTMAEGTAPVPTYLQGRVEAAWERLSILNELTITNFKGIVAVPYEVSASPAVFHAEGGDAVTEEQLVIGQTLLQPVMLKKFLRVSDEVESLTDEQFMDYIADEIIYQINLLAETSVVSRNAQTGIVGMTNSDLAVSVTSALSFNSINEGLAELVEAVDPVVIVNRKTFFNNIMGLTDLQQRPIYQIATDNASKPAYFVNGVRVLFSNGLKDYDTASNGDPWAIVGDLRAYRLNLPNGRIPTVLYDPYTQAEADMNKYVGKLLAAGDIVRPDAIAVLLKASTEDGGGTNQ